jgi:hypothetical protein
MVIAVLFAPVLQEFVKFWLNQPRKNPAISKQNPLIRRVMLAISPFTLPVILVAGNIIWLLFEMRKYAHVPITATIVVVLSVRVALIFLGIMMLFVSHVAMTLAGHISRKNSN